jgi:hypothetical protein
MADQKYHGMKVVDMRKGEIRSVIRRAFNNGLQNCRNVIVIVEGQKGGVYVDWSSLDISHSLRLLEITYDTLKGSAKGRS